MIEASEKTKNGTTGENIQDLGGENAWRKSSQALLPGNIAGVYEVDANYNPIPFHSLGASRIFSGFDGLADWIIQQKTVVIDGYGGVFFDEIQSNIQAALQLKGVTVKWQNTAKFLKSESEVQEMTKPFMGGDEDVWGFKTNLSLEDFFHAEQLRAVAQDESADINIVIGIGAAMVEWDAAVVYIDLPKNEIQYRMRAESITNLGITAPERPFTMYKRFYFVDWVVLNDYKSKVLDRVAVFADGQRAGEITWIAAKHFLDGLTELSKTAFRARPWFEKGSWGGQWMKNRLDGLNEEEVNYAWSFELITPENGLVFESDGHLLEVSFDFLMMKANEAVLGKHASLFGAYFPIRFDFLDTFEGGNLSIQCHPSKAYIQEQFGETITQDETYYIMDCEQDAKVYLGFQEDIEKDKFREELELSEREKTPIDVEKYVRSFPSKKHELYLIPNGTVHSSGINNMVLEISATPYIFTFKMYDWLSLDLTGKPRPININHAFNNLNFDRKGEAVERELIAHPVKIDGGNNWSLIHLPTHPDHFYDVHRIEFETEVVVKTEQVCHVLMLVEGSAISVRIDGALKKFNYAETFIVPASVTEYVMINQGSEPAKVVKAFLKDNITI